MLELNFQPWKPPVPKYTEEDVYELIKACKEIEDAYNAYELFPGNGEDGKKALQFVFDILSKLGVSS